MQDRKYKRTPINSFKRDRPNRKMAKIHSYAISEEEIQIVNKHRRRSTPLVIKERQVKAAGKYTLHPSAWPKPDLEMMKRNKYSLVGRSADR